MGDPIGVDVKLGETGPASLEFEYGGIAAGLGPRAHHIGKILPVLCDGHDDSPWKTFVVSYLRPVVPA
jgi:hypothetical protein